MMYKFLTETTLAKIDDDGKSRMSCTTDNSEYQQWLAEGNTPIPAEVQSRWPAIQQIRDELIDNGGCQVGQYWFHSDPKSKQQQMALTMLGANIPAGLKWKSMTGVMVDMTPALAQQIFIAQITRESQIFANAEIIKNDPDMDIHAGWPERFVK
jgi:hypothetical protein